MNIVEEDNTKTVNFLLNNLNFGDIYNDIVNDVFNNYKMIFQENIYKKIVALKFDFSQYIDKPLTDLLTENPNGKVLINNAHYSVNPNFFVIINIAAFESLAKTLNAKVISARTQLKEGNVEDSVRNSAYTFKNQLLKLLKKELKNHYDFKRVNRKGAYPEFYYDSKEEYIYSCINSGLLNAIILTIKNTTIYSDYEEINRQKIIL